MSKSWIEWRGDFNNPIELATVEIKLRNGTTRRVYAHLVKWTHNRSPFDVVAYKPAPTKRDPKP